MTTKQKLIDALLTEIDAQAEQPTEIHPSPEELWEKHRTPNNPSDEWEPHYMTLDGFKAALSEARALAAGAANG